MTGKPFDVVILGATGFTGRQAVRAMRRQGEGLRWAIAGRNAPAMQVIIGAGTKSAAGKPGVLLADTTDAESLHTLASQTRVLLNMAGPYALTGEAVVQACIANGTHCLDLTGETFWVRQLIERHHRAAQQAGVKIIPSCGYEVLPFDLATLWIADALRQRHGQACRDVKLVVSFTGKRMTSLADAASGGTVASMRMLLELDKTDCVRNMACLLPEARDDAQAVARRSAIAWVPQYDADLKCVTAPTVPAPFINPPMVLRSWALIADETLFTSDFRYHEGTHMGSLTSVPGFLPAAASAAAAVRRGGVAERAAGRAGRDGVGTVAVPAQCAAQADRALCAKARRRAERGGAGRNRLCVRHLRHGCRRPARAGADGGRRPPRLSLDARDGGGHGQGPGAGHAGAHAALRHRHAGERARAGSGRGAAAGGRALQPAVAASRLPSSRRSSRRLVFSTQPSSPHSASAASVMPVVQAAQKPGAPCSASGARPVVWKASAKPPPEPDAPQRRRVDQHRRHGQMVGAQDERGQDLRRVGNVEQRHPGQQRQGGGDDRRVVRVGAQQARA